MTQPVAGLRHVFKSFGFHVAVRDLFHRIAEVMLGSVRAFEFMLGKVLGGVAVSMTATLVHLVMDMRYILKYPIRALTSRPLFAGVAVLTLVGALALTSSVIPARRIAGVSPQDALRVE